MEPWRPALINKIVYFTGCRHNPYMSFGGTYMFYPVFVLGFIEAFSLKVNKQEKRTRALVCAGLGRGGGPCGEGSPLSSLCLAAALTCTIFACLKKGRGASWALDQAHLFRRIKPDAWPEI